MGNDRIWVNEAIRKLEANFNRSADTHLFRVDLPGVRGVEVNIKDESAHYLYGATDDAGLDLRAGYLLHWHIVGALGGERFKFYDLGGSSRNHGLRQFKAGLSGRAGLTVDIPCEHDYASNRLVSLCGQSLHLLRYMKNGGMQAGHRTGQTHDS